MTKDEHVSLLQEQILEITARAERAEKRIKELEQYHGGHFPDCGGIDEENMRCGCGYLDGAAYRKIEAATIERLTEQVHELLFDLDWDGPSNPNLDVIFDFIQAAEAATIERCANFVSDWQPLYLGDIAAALRALKDGE